MWNDDFLNRLWELSLKWLNVVVVNREHAALSEHSIIDENRFDCDWGIRRKRHLSPIDPLVRETGFIFGDSVDPVDPAVLVQPVRGQEIDRGIRLGGAALVVVGCEEQCYAKALGPVQKSRRYPVVLH